MGNQYIKVARPKVIKPLNEITPAEYEMSMIQLGPETHEGDLHMYQQSFAGMVVRNKDYKKKIDELKEKCELCHSMCNI